MLTGIRVLVIGGDARQLEVMRKCAALDASVHAVGFDRLSEKIPGVTLAPLREELLESADALILPVVGCDENGAVSATFAEASLQLLEEHVSVLPGHCTIYTGMAKPYLRELSAKYGLKLVELLDRDDVAIYNSIPTAEGAIMMAIQHTEITIHQSKCIVLGMGRTGFTLAKTLQGMGADVKVGIRWKDEGARAAVMGWKPFATKYLADEVGGIDLLFNTIPSMIITAQILSRMPRSAVIIDLASAPGGCDFSSAEKIGIKAFLAPGLPGIVAPKTAGLIMADALVQQLLEDNPNREEGV
ncbi:dipicolinate synthase subunit DpsA [Paenibacillus sp. P96]|uniref:Dipicolinate synthase subunit DpsA n=1 Tax=Paenibacillus zeirhizosphaerae TaxID=2987519 RepID=A0ABT9FRX8_9BACL|nr:dipicolinate synthase subunit DpsA [Paenibacillus sp. P96]MDP4097488.1 dipicolinate synthase subunit DpsA [Paenibacillus sp. P96]